VLQWNTSPTVKPYLEPKRLPVLPITVLQLMRTRCFNILNIPRKQILVT